MDTVVLDHLRTWIGNSRSDEDVISVRQARLMAATVDYAPEEIRDGKPLPPLWHWIYFLEGLPTDALGRDGHPARGGFLPPVPLSNRMCACRSCGRFFSESRCARSRASSAWSTNRVAPVIWSS